MLSGRCDQSAIGQDSIVCAGSNTLLTRAVMANVGGIVNDGGWNIGFGE